MAKPKTKQIQERRRRTRHNTKTNHVVVSIKSFPCDLVVDVLARVAAGSLPDFLNAKFSCREWNELGDENYVYRHASLSSIPIVLGWPPQTAENKRKTTLFLDKCTDAGNLEALYRRGLVGYLGCKEVAECESSLGCLKKAANGGHTGALYAISIISIFLGGEDKKNGIDVLTAMKSSKLWRKEVRKARQQLLTIIRTIWVRNFLVFAEKPVCCTAADHRTGKNTGWGWGAVDGDDEDDSSVECTSCNCDLEISHVYKALPPGRVLH